jgi:hypothetical protein
MVQQEVRGFYVIKCPECPFRKDNLGGYDRELIVDVSCMLKQRLIDKSEEDTDGFPRMCPLSPIKNADTLIFQRYKRIVQQLKIIKEIIKDE